MLVLPQKDRLEYSPSIQLDGLKRGCACLDVSLGALNIQRFFEHVPLRISCRKSGELGTMAGFARFWSI
jgi:hypothetical protein